MSFKGRSAEKHLWHLHHGSLVCVTSMISIAPPVNAYHRTLVTQHTENKKQNKTFSHDWYKNFPCP